MDDSRPEEDGPLPHAGSPAAALDMCTDMFGEVRLPVIAVMLGQDEDQARRSLGILVFDDPETGRLETARAYLSGPVGAKLRAAFEAGTGDPRRFSANVTALREVLPPEIPSSGITAQLGAPWIGKHHITEFVQDLLEPGRRPGSQSEVRVEHPGGTVWDVTGPGSLLSEAVWGTRRYPAPELIQALLEKHPIEVRDPVPGTPGPGALNVEETRAALDCAEKIEDRFTRWVRESRGRDMLLTRAYNTVHNDIVPRRYDGTRLSLPGLSPQFRPDRQQAGAVARILGEPAAGIFHARNGGGREAGQAAADSASAVLIIAAMEMRRLGQARKPLIAVPRAEAGHGQFPAAFRRLYPQARILSAGAQAFNRDERDRFLRDAAGGDWDAVIIPEPMLQMIPVPDEFRRSYLTRDLDAVNALIYAARADRETAVLPRLEEAREETRERTSRAVAAARRASGVTIEDSGIDAIMVKDPQGLHNLGTRSAIPSERVAGSARVTDLHMKTEWARSRGHKIVMAGAEPPAGGDPHTLLRYLRPDLLRDTGMLERDAWIAAHGKTEHLLGRTPWRNPGRTRTAVTALVNVPELTRLLQVAADVRPAAAPAPPDPAVIEVIPTPATKASMDDLARRAGKIFAGTAGTGTGGPDEDNIVTVFTEHDQAAADLRLTGKPMDGKGKLHAVADQAAARWEQHRAHDGVQGRAVQLVFCDHPAPRGRWNARDELRRLLADRGVPPRMIRVAADADGNGDRTGRLAGDCREGQVAVLLADSRSQAATAPSVQDSVAAVHYVNAPRQGDWNRHQSRRDPPVPVIRYITRGSADAARWHAIDRTDQFIQQVMRGGSTRTASAAEPELTFADITRLAAGVPPPRPATGRPGPPSRYRKNPPPSPGR